MSLEQLSKLANDQWQAEKAVKAAEQAVKDRKKELRKISEELIPELMDELAMEKFTTTDGINVSVNETIRASIPAKHKAAAFTWLRENGHAKMIKRTLSVVSPSDEAGNLLAELLRANNYEHNDNPAVHPSTLSAFVREMLAEGEEVPQDLLGVFRQRISKVKV